MGGVMDDFAFPPCFLVKRMVSVLVLTLEVGTGVCSVPIDIYFVFVVILLDRDDDDVVVNNLDASFLCRVCCDAIGVLVLCVTIDVVVRTIPSRGRYDEWEL
jgi:hypothetical protein